MKRKLHHWLLLIVAGGALYSGGWIHSQYVGRTWPFSHVLSDVSKTTNSNDGENHPDEGHHDHSGHDHSGSSSENVLELSETARKNIGLTEEALRPIELQEYKQTITVPAIIVDRPGRTRLPISASMTGIVTHVHAATGEAVKPGDLILEMRLTHEDLVTAQKDYLQSLGDRDIELKEIARIEGIANSGAISPKTLLERQYNRDKLESLLRSQREGLRLHGLTDAQLTAIDDQRRLLTEIRVYAPIPDDHADEEIRLGLDHQRELVETPDPSASVLGANAVLPSRIKDFQESSSATTAMHVEGRGHGREIEDANSNQLLVLTELNVQKGQIVNAGETLCVLADYAVLLAEGEAFEAEAGQIVNAKQAGWAVSAEFGVHGNVERIDDLPWGWIDNEVDPSHRTMKFYVHINNELIEDAISASGQRHIAWKFRIGQRLELKVPIARWTDQIVLPVNAVVQEGLESFVFRQNGDQFERIPIHERLRDQSQVVVESDGALFPGDVVALRGAHQMEMALKSKSGSGVDPHAGHSH